MTSKTNIPKNHKQLIVAVNVYDLDGKTPVEAANFILLAADGLIDPVLVAQYDYDDTYLTIQGYVPMTQKEIDAAERRRERARKANRARRLKDQLRQEKELKKLADKLGYKIEKEEE